MDTISAINDVAMMLEDMGRIEEARAHAERAYEMNFRWQGPGHTETALMAHNLALTIMNEFPSDVLAAVPLLRLSLKTNEKIYGADNVDGTAYERKTLGQCLIQCCDWRRQCWTHCFTTASTLQTLVQHWPMLTSSGPMTKQLPMLASFS